VRVRCAQCDVVYFAQGRAASSSTRTATLSSDLTASRSSSLTHASHRYAPRSCGTWNRPPPPPPQPYAAQPPRQRAATRRSNVSRAAHLPPCAPLMLHPLCVSGHRVARWALVASSLTGTADRCSTHRAAQGRPLIVPAAAAAKAREALCRAQAAETYAARVAYDLGRTERAAVSASSMRECRRLTT
jgi:hypothetical protein